MLCLDSVIVIFSYFSRPLLLSASFYLSLHWRTLNLCRLLHAGLGEESDDFVENSQEDKKGEGDVEGPVMKKSRLKWCSEWRKHRIEQYREEPRTHLILTRTESKNKLDFLNVIERRDEARSSKAHPASRLLVSHPLIKLKIYAVSSLRRILYLLYFDFPYPWTSRCTPKQTQSPDCMVFSFSLFKCTSKPLQVLARNLSTQWSCCHMSRVAACSTSRQNRLPTTSSFCCSKKLACFLVRRFLARQRPLLNDPWARTYGSRQSLTLSLSLYCGGADEGNPIYIAI